MTKLSKKETAATLRLAQQAIERACVAGARKGVPFHAQSSYSKMCRLISEQEREHMRFGKRLLGHTPARAHSHATRVAYFVQKCVLTPTRIRSAVDAHTTRQDYVIGAAIAQAVGMPAIKAQLKRSGVSLEALASINYTDLTGDQ